jgi:hypothetical protein
VLVHCLCLQFCRKQYCCFRPSLLFGLYVDILHLGQSRIKTTCVYANMWPWPLTLKINRVPDSPKDYVCTKFGQNPLKDLDSRVFTRMLCGKNLTRWPSPLNILQLILTNLGTYLDLKRIWNPIDFQGQRSRSQGLIFRRGDTLRFALPLFIRTMYVPSLVKIHWRILILECSQGCYGVKIWPGDLDLWPMTLKINRVPDSLKD